MVAIIVVATVLVFLTADYFVQRRHAARHAAASAAVAGAGRGVSSSVVRADPLDPRHLPQGVFFAPGHTWVGLESAGGVRIGANRLPLWLLGGVDRLELLPVGSEVRTGDAMAVLRCRGRELRLRSPVDGTVARVNSRLQVSPDAMRNDPFAGGWLCALRPRRLSDALRRMFVAEEAEEWLAREVTRLREFVTGLELSGAPVPATLPDGGLPVEGLAGLLDDGQWEELVERFFEVATPQTGDTGSTPTRA